MRGGDPAPKATHVAVYEPRRLLGHSLALLLSGQEDIELVGYAASITSAAQLCGQRHIDVLVCGLGGDPGGVLADAHTLSRRFAHIRLIAISDTADEREYERVLSHGFRTVVPTSAGGDNLLQVVRAGAPVHRRRRPTSRNDDSRGPLTPREAEVLALVGRGSTAHDISEQLGISRSTVTSHKERIFTKLDANNQAHAVARAVSMGIINPAREEDPRRAG